MGTLVVGAEVGAVGVRVGNPVGALVVGIGVGAKVGGSVTFCTVTAAQR